jgi:outer membrane protein assembly factor BamB
MFADKGVATCIEARTGAEIWTQRIGGNFSSSPLLADGRIYLGSEEGLVHVLQPGREYKSLAINELEGRVMASPAVIDNALFIRTDKAIYRFEKR